MTVLAFTTLEKAECAERELRLRERVYPRRVEDGRMTKAHADKQIALMAAIAADYRAQAEAEEPRLF